MSNVDVSYFVDQINERLKQRDRLVEVLQGVSTRAGRSCPEQILRQLLKEREVVLELLKQSGAVENVGADGIAYHLDWLVPKFLRPVSWKAINREKLVPRGKTAMKERT